MYAICNIKGQQEKVEPGRTLHVAFMKSSKEGDKIVLDEVMLVSENGTVRIGKPLLDTKVLATVVSHGRDPKVIVYHKKKRAHYHKMRGHHQKFTQIRIDSIQG
jgi:large subunit ribosomal protein L21